MVNFDGCNALMTKIIVNKYRNKLIYFNNQLSNWVWHTKNPATEALPPKTKSQI